MGLTAPEPLTDEHVLEGFQCGVPDLARWLINRARKNQREGASRVFVVCKEQRDVVGYYALAAGSVAHALAPGSIRRNMPDPVPVAVLGRLAVHRDWTGRGIGGGLLRDAVMRTAQLSERIGIRALLCHAIDDEAKAFYLKYGFVESPVDPLTLMLSIVPLRDSLLR